LDKGKIDRVVGMGTVLLSGLIHIYNVPGEYKEAPYLGVLFFVFFLASIASAIGIYYDRFMWGWILGGLLSLGAIIGYLVSRTVGLPISGVENWGPPLAYFSIFLELLFFVPFIRVANPRLTRSPY
jgi:hypothetical protein